MFARAWGVLASWVHDNARAAIWRGIIAPREDQPDRAARRDLLTDVLLDRMPGEQSHLSSRLLQAIWRADTARGARHQSQQQEERLSKQLQNAVRCCNIEASELRVLEKQLDPELVDVNWSLNKVD